MSDSGSMSAREIVAGLGASPTLAKLIGAAKRLDALNADGRLACRFAIVRNVTLEPGLPAALKVAAAEFGLRASLHLGDFDNAEATVLDSSSALYAAEPDLVIVALRLQGIAPRLVLQFAELNEADRAELEAQAVERLLSLAGAIRARSAATILVHGFEQPVQPAFGILDAAMPHGQRRTVAALNERLATGLAAIPGAFIVDVDRLIAEIGYRQALDQRYWHIARAPYSVELQTRLAREYVTFAAALKGKAKKCLVLDCDNTLWGGTIGEDGLAGIALGATSPGSAFVEMQAAVLNFYERGVLLALASKNNLEDVLEVFSKHPASLLKPEHFVAKGVNWRDKAANLREIAASLNIGIDSLVFVDDNPFECAFVREQLPEVVVIELPKDPSRFADVIRGLPYFETLSLSAEDRRRSEMYRVNEAREGLRTASGSIADYLRSLAMTVTVRRADAFSIPRIAQLTQKTNQFNLTTRRYSEADIARMAADPNWHAYCADVKDRFDHAGIVAVALVHDEGETARVDTFLMSCRVIGRGVEAAFLSVVAEDCASRGIRSLTAEYLPTPKNEPAAAFLPDSGFRAVPESDGRRWGLDLAGGIPKVPEWFAAVRVEVAETAAAG